MEKFTMTREEYLKRRIYLKRQHIIIIKDDVRELEKQLKSLNEKQLKARITL